MAFAALQWQASNSKNQLVLGPNGQQAVLSAENFGQISVIKLPDPGTATTNFILEDSKLGSQTVKGNLVVTGTVTSSGGSGGDELLNGNLVFNNAADREITWNADQTADGSSLSILGNSSDGGNGGDVNITSGAALSGSKAAGDVNISGADGFGTGAGGDVILTGGLGGLSGGGGNITLLAGEPGATSGDGGNVKVTANNATGTGLGGQVTIDAGNGGTAQTGGKVAITAGDGKTTGVGGAIELTGGAGGASGAGGALTLLSGGAAGAASGAVNIDVGLGTTNGDINIGAGANAPATITIGKSSMTGNVTVAKTLTLGTAGTQLQMKGGAATDFIGTVTLVAGTATVLNTNIAATDRILLSRHLLNASPAVGFLTYVINAGVSFVITSYTAAAAVANTDVTTVDYVIVRQV